MSHHTIATEIMYSIRMGTSRQPAAGDRHSVVRAKKIAFNPCKFVMPHRAVKKELAYLTIEQVQKLLEVAKDHKLECLLTIALATGMRLGELLALQSRSANRNSFTDP